MTAHLAETKRSRSWMVLFGLGILLILNMLFLIFMGGSGDQFEADTGIAWAEVDEAYPSVTALVAGQERLLGIGYLGFALFATVIAFGPYRRGERWGWNAMWILPAIMGLTAVMMFAFGSVGIGGWYAFLTLVPAVTLLVARRSFSEPVMG